jgi:hypothetical protein
MMLVVLMEAVHYSTGPIGKYLAVVWWEIATLVVFAIGLVRHKRLRTVAAVAALLLAIYGLASNLFFSGTASS